MVLSYLPLVFLKVISRFLIFGWLYSMVNSEPSWWYNIKTKKNMYFFKKTSLTTKITLLLQYRELPTILRTRTRISLSFLFLNIFSHIKNMFHFSYLSQKIHQQRKLRIVSLRTSLKNNIKNMAFLIKNKLSPYYQKIKGHKIICFTVLTMKNPKIQVYVAKVYQLFARFTSAFKKVYDFFCGLFFANLRK